MGKRAEGNSLDRLVEEILASPKYRDISPDLVRNISMRELAKRHTDKEALKATRSKLHQIGGAYFDGQAHYGAWLAQLADIIEQATPDTPHPGGTAIHPQRGHPPSGGHGGRPLQSGVVQIEGWADTPKEGLAIKYPALQVSEEVRGTSPQAQQRALQELCKQIMSHHTSTRERLPILDQFYSTILADLAPVHSILDLACGLNPLAIPWMPLAEGASYYAYDIYQQMTAFLQEWLRLMRLPGEARACDILQSCPMQEVDVALMLKTLPCLEQIDKQAGRRLLRTLKARHIIVSFPVHSLGGRSKGMATYYEAHFREMFVGEDWSVKRHAFATELVFIVSKQGKEVRDYLA